MNLLRLLVRVLSAPGRLVIVTLDDLKRSNGVAPLGTFLRGCVHGFIGLFVLAAIAMAIVPPAPAAPRSSTTQSYTAPSAPMEMPTVAPTATVAPSPTSAAPVPAYAPLPDDEDDHDEGESRYCRRRWWC